MPDAKEAPSKENISAWLSLDGMPKIIVTKPKIITVKKQARQIIAFSFSPLRALNPMTLFKTLPPKIEEKKTPKKLNIPETSAPCHSFSLPLETTEKIAFGASVEPLTKTTKTAATITIKSRGVSIFAKKFINPPKEKGSFGVDYQKHASLHKMYLRRNLIMILEKEYLRERAVMYAKKYALVRNPLFYTFEGIGGNCTNFASQCVLAGSCTMNYAPVYGWYYLSLNRRSASWTGVDFFYNFMTTNADVGPFGREVDISLSELGDLIQLKNVEGRFYHTLVITRIEENEIYICANSNDALERPLSSYDYESLRVIHIDGVRYDTRFQIDCFDSLYSPPIPPIQPQPPVEEPPTEEPPTEEPPTEDPPAEEPPTEEPPVVEAPTEESPAEESTSPTAPDE